MDEDLNPRRRKECFPSPLENS